MVKFILTGVCALTLFFASCTKDNFESIEETSSKSVTVRTAESISTSVVSSSESIDFLTLKFSSTENLSEVEPASVQSLLFTDLSENTVVLNLSIESYDYVEGNLEITFDKENQVLTGLEIQTAQDVIIEDIDFN